MRDLNIAILEFCFNIIVKFFEAIYNPLTAFGNPSANRPKVKKIMK